MKSSVQSLHGQTEIILTNTPITTARVNDYAVNEWGEIAVAGDAYINLYAPDGSYQKTLLLTPARNEAFALDYSGDVLSVSYIRFPQTLRIETDGTLLEITDSQQPDTAARVPEKSGGSTVCHLNAQLTSVTLVQDGQEIPVYTVNVPTAAGDWIYVVLIAVTAVAALLYRFKEKGESAL